MYQDLQIEKYIVFRIADYFLALPIGDVLKVVNCPPGTNEGLRTMGVVQLGRHAIRVLNLHHQLLESNDVPRLPGNQIFLVITRTPQGELCGIAVDEPPNLIELPIDMMQRLPQFSSQFNALEIASHAAVITQEEKTTTIFLLDLKRAMNFARNDSPLRAV